MKQCVPILSLFLSLWLAFALSLAIAALPDRTIAQTITECLIQAKEVARIGAADRGVLARVHVERADKVGRDQILAELEATEEDAQVALARLRVGSDIAVRLARAKVAAAELNAERLTTLVERNLVPKSDQEAAILAAQSARLEEEEAIYQLEVAKLQLAAALSARERKRIRAPFDGVVTDTLLSAGELYNEQGPIMVLARIDPLNVEAYLPAARRRDVAVGQIAEVTLETGGVASATLEVIDPVLDAATGTFGVRLALPNPEGRILAGQSCGLRLTPG
ncbi:efflux RND transporter periplasmic adaptor subunit [Pseudooceanicola sp.]|uniref:efflux RND transporter periplasmic adaptor subunit n=1 Tax=Pseudooceanicola sp. TaxID=1914328 RepID=UPI00261DB60C|nr:efflux RND transporter periplasmic adaptor subunit [Pseudooceanicola sp.]MDF1855741.1 efflux RND transporter periplasmic adaptor subunit [Pseudooceanicola sp.]